MTETTEAWGSEWTEYTYPSGRDDDFGDDDDDEFIIGDDDVPQVDMIDEEIPLAEAPATGDNFSPWAMVSLISGIGLISLNLFGKKREEENA